jgi:hypothetical protein
MVLNISNYDGTQFVTIPDNYLNTTSSSLELPGRGYQSYGTAINQDLLWLMQHFARDIPPDVPVEGQLWWDTGSSLLKIYNGIQWISGSSIPITGLQPANPVDGSLWWDTSHNPPQLNIYANGAWRWIGPPGYEYWTSTQNNIPYANQVYSVGSAAYQLSQLHTADAYVYRDATVGRYLTVANSASFGSLITSQGTNAVYQGYQVTSAPLNQKWWWRAADTNSLVEYITDDTNTNARTWLEVNRSANVITDINFVTNTNNAAVTINSQGNVKLNNPQGALVFPDGSVQRYAPFTRTNVFYQSTTWNVPLNVSWVKARVWGAGGGGGGNYVQGASGGGGGGGYSEEILFVTPGSSIVVTVGQGGLGGGNSSVSASANNGLSGGSSSFGNLISATGGVGGFGSLTGSYGVGGIGGRGYGNSLVAAGGLGSAGFTIGTSGLGGAGGAAAMGGAGGAAGPGYSGSFPGGGGGGGINNNQGGVGANGVVVVEY